MLLSQGGRLDLRSLEVLLACDEKATYHQGTDTRTEMRRVYERAIHRAAATEIRPDTPFAAECRLEIPAGAMHSFKADHNEILWRLVVRGEPVGDPSALSDRLTQLLTRLEQVRI